MDIFDSCYYRTIRCFMCFIGQWPYDNSLAKSVLRFIFCAFIGSFIQVQISKFFTSEWSMNLCIEIVPIMLLYTISLTKYACYWYKEKHLKAILDSIQSEWNTIIEENEINVLKKSAEEVNFYGFLTHSFTYTAIGFFMSLQYAPGILDIIIPLNESRPNYHPFLAEYFIDSKKYFYPILVHMHISTLLAMTIIVGTDKMFFLIFLHACGMYNIIGYRLQHLFDINENANIRSENGCDFLEEIVRVVNYHRKIIEYIRFTESCVVNFYIVQLVLTVIIITGLLLQLHNLLSPLENVELAAITFFRLLGVFLVSFLNILPGQRILDCSDEIYRKAYFGYWYTAPVKTQKLFLFLMGKMAKPYVVSFDNFINITFALYATVVRMTLSYFTAIQSIQ